MRRWATAAAANKRESCVLLPTGPVEDERKEGKGTAAPDSLSERSASFTPLLLMIWQLLPMLAFSSTTQRRRKQLSPVKPTTRQARCGSHIMNRAEAQTGD